MEKYRFAYLNKWFVLRTIGVIFMWYFAYQSFNIVKDIEELETFVPHEILGVAPDAEVSKIKKAYRKLSREKHPDKNPDNPKAVTEFI